MLTEKEQQLNDVLRKVTEPLDVSPSKYKEAIERYHSLKEHLEGGTYPETNIPPEVYIQGSFRLGTVIRPYKEGKDADYDIDVVCRLKQGKGSSEPRKLKNDVGAEVKTYAQKNNMRSPEEKRRCWVLKYAPDSSDIGFHMDVLPCVHDQELAEYISREDPTLEQYANTTIAITNRDDAIRPPKYDWRSGNPHGYAKWFWDVNYPGFVIFEKEQKKLLFESNRSIYSSDKDVPSELVRTPLQRVIQILKRHRDIHFAGNKLEEHKPISMIITTLSARIYEGNADHLRTTYSALNYIVQQLILHASLLEAQYLSEDIAQLKLIQRVGNKWYIPNPVNPHNPGDPEGKGENFADRWHEDNHACARAFFEWLGKLKKDFDTAFNQNNIHDITQALSHLFVGGSVRRVSGGIETVKPTDKVYPVVTMPSNPNKLWAY